MRYNTKIRALRVVLGVLIILNMAVIFFFSAQSGEESGKTSGKVTEIVTETVVKDYDQKPVEEQEKLVASMHPYVRKAAHMAEFGSLGALIFLFLLTWRGGILLRYLGSLAAVFLYACSDEFHQSFSEARGPGMTDVLIDLLGAAIACSIIFAICILVRRARQKREGDSGLKITRYHLRPDRKDLHLRIALVADLHGDPHEKLFSVLENEKPDLILIPGDLMEEDQIVDKASGGFEFLRACAKLAPTVYSLGNHEIGCHHKGNIWAHPTPTPLSEEAKLRIRETGAIFLDNEIVERDGICFCGLTSGLNGKKNAPDQEVIRELNRRSGFRVMLCHHPEYYVPYIQGTDIELTVCGHAHGGQWRVFGRGIYAPGQGLFPKYTAGVLDDRCVISRGLGNHTFVPRIFNPRELVMIEYGS